MVGRGFLPHTCVYDTRAQSAHTPWVQSVCDVSACWFIEVGLGTPSRYLANNQLESLVIIIIIRLQYESLGSCNTCSGQTTMHSLQPWMCGCVPTACGQHTSPLTAAISSSSFQLSAAAEHAVHAQPANLCVSQVLAVAALV